MRRIGDKTKLVNHTLVEYLIASFMLLPTTSGQLSYGNYIPYVHPPKLIELKGFFIEDVIVYSFLNT